MPFVKIYDTILRSSIWLEDPVTRIVWITLLTLADLDGHVEASVPGLAHAANVPVECCRDALETLASPDPDSKDPANEGRRIRASEGGWDVLNYQKYREMPGPSAIRMRRWRAKQASSQSDDVTAEAEAEAEAEADISTNQSFDQARARANPLVEGRRPQMETEVLRMVGELAEIEGKDPIEVLARAAHYEGARTTKINPAAMSDDRLANTWQDLRATLKRHRGEGPSAETWDARLGPQRKGEEQ